jgi:hypothetical protein
MESNSSTITVYFSVELSANLLTLYKLRVFARATARFRVLHHLLYVVVEYLFAVSQNICIQKLHLLVLPWLFFHDRSLLLDSVLLLRGHSARKVTIISRVHVEWTFDKRGIILQ